MVGVHGLATLEVTQQHYQKLHSMLQVLISMLLTSSYIYEILPLTLFVFTSEGFIQPTFVDLMLQADDPGGFVDRQLFDFPPERSVYTLMS